jgi:hypothetical protein
MQIPEVSIEIEIDCVIKLPEINLQYPKEVLAAMQSDTWPIALLQTEYICVALKEYHIIEDGIETGIRSECGFRSLEGCVKSQPSCSHLVNDRLRMCAIRILWCAYICKVIRESLKGNW